jgi:hypothetical protein
MVPEKFRPDKCKQEKTKFDSVSQFGDKIESNDSVLLKKDRKKETKGKSTPLNYYFQHSNVPHIPPKRPSTALERRSSRPSTSNLVRSKAEHFRKNLLDPIQLGLLSTKDVPPSATSSLHESEWENELARHIISVFNN